MHPDVNTGTANALTADMEELINSHMQAVAYQARKYKKKCPDHVDIKDIFNYGVLGLIDAAKKFDPGKGNKFETYAQTRIRGAIIDGLRSSTPHSRSVSRFIREFNDTFKDMAPDEIALAISEKTYDPKRRQALLEIASRLYNGQGIGTLSIDQPQDSKNPRSDKSTTIADSLVSTFIDPLTAAIENEQKRKLARAIAELPPRERNILVDYYYEGKTMEQIGKQEGIARSRVSQIVSAATSKIQEQLKPPAGSAKAASAVGRIEQERQRSGNGHSQTGI